MTSCPEAMGWYFWWFWKEAVSWDLTLDEASWDSDLGESSWDYGIRRAFVGSVSWDSDSGPSVQLGSWLKNDVETAGIVKIVCLSPRIEKTKSQKKLINVSYLNYQESSVFRDSYAYEHFTYPYISHIRIMAIQYNDSNHYTTNTSFIGYVKLFIQDPCIPCLLGTLQFAIPLISLSKSRSILNSLPFSMLWTSLFISNYSAFLLCCYWANSLIQRCFLWFEYACSIFFLHSLFVGTYYHFNPCKCRGLDSLDSNLLLNQSIFKTFGDCFKRANSN